MMRTGYKIPTEADIQSERALYNILEPRYHHLVPEWMKTATDAEKQGVIKLARISEPKLLKTIGRPRMDSFEPTLKEHAWYHKRGNPALRPRVDTIEKFPMDPAEYQVPSWLNEDLYEAEQIPKPGGCILKLKDSINIMRQKNWTRNQGTYQMFSGSFDGTTTTGSCHGLSLSAIQVGRNPVQDGGDFELGDGRGGESIYGGKFNDEAGGLALRHAKRGLLSMANSGRDTNGSQFFILFKPAHHLNGKHCVFGELVEGQATLDAIEGVKTTSDDKPIAPITIARCGQVERRVVGVRPVKRKKEKEAESSASESSSDKKKKKKKDKKKKKKD
ncbi:unnamed protein product [Effrenium voratum]|nr:unnamed protein product [Effrenium voratum]